MAGRDAFPSRAEGPSSLSPISPTKRLPAPSSSVTSRLNTWLHKTTHSLRKKASKMRLYSGPTDGEVRVRNVKSPEVEYGGPENTTLAGKSQSGGPHSASIGERTLPLEMLFREGQEEGAHLQDTQQHHFFDREGQTQQDSTRIPLATERLLSSVVFSPTANRSLGRSIGTGTSSRSSRAQSRSTRSYEPSDAEQGERGEYTFSGNTSPLLSASFPNKSTHSDKDEAFATQTRLRSHTSFLDRPYDDSTITQRGRNSSRTFDKEHTIRRASTKGVPVQSPFPNLKIPGRHPSSVVDLEEAAERLSMADSIEDSIRKEYEDIKRVDSRKSSMRRGSLMEIVTDIPYGAEPKQLGELFQSPTSFIDPARSGGYSPSGAILAKGRSRADSKCSKTSAYGTRPEPPLEGMPLAQFVAPGASVSRQNSQYSVISSRNISRAQSIAELEQEMAGIRRPLAVRNPSKDELDGDLGEQPGGAGLSRPVTQDSKMEIEQSQQLFEDFDGQHINETPPVEPEQPPQLRPELGKRKSTAALLSPTVDKFERPKSYADPLTGQQMVFYPAPVPSMLRLPPKLSNRPNAKERAKRHTQVLASAPKPAHVRNKSSVWLPDVVDEEEKRKSFMDIDLGGPSNSSDTGAPARPKDVRRNTTQPALPEHLRANEYFEQMAPTQVVEIKEQSAVKTLDDILDASAHAPVSAFTDHAFAGAIGAEVYGTGHRKTRTKSTLFGSQSGLLDPEGKENKKPVLGKRASSFFGLINKSEDALGGDRKSTLGILGRGKSPVYDAVGEKSPTFQREDARDPSDDEDEDGEQREMDGRYAEDVYNGAPTTLLAELQLRKQQAKQRTQPTFLPNGFRTTLLEMDSVAQVEEKNRKGKRVTLAWQDQDIVQRERDQESEDEEVPLGMLFPEQARRQQDNAVRPMGLMERRELEDNEPLSKRRERLLGKKPLMRPELVKRASTMMNFPGKNNSGETITPGGSVSQVNLLGLSDTGAIPTGRPISGEFSSELIGRFGTPEPKLSAEGALEKEIPEEEETLGQRRKRLIAEKEAREKEVRSGTPDQAAAEPRPTIKQRRSMADVLQAHPARTPSPGHQQLHSRRSSQDLLGARSRNNSSNRLSSMNRLSSANLAAPKPTHERTHSQEFPHLAAIEKERQQKAQIAAMQAEIQAQQHLQHTNMRGMGLLGSNYAGSGLDYQSQQGINSGMALGSQQGLGVPMMAGMVGPKGGIMMASPNQASTQSGYFGNKEMVDRMIATRLQTQAALQGGRPGQLPQVAGGFIAPQQMLGTGLGMGLNHSVGTGSYGMGSQGPMGGQRGMGQMGLGRGMGPQNQGEWRNQQAQWAHWARMQGLGMGLGGAVQGVGNGGVDMVEAWRRGVGGQGEGVGQGF